jgi:Flp pilus assembly CpaE family ATPase
MRHFVSRSSGTADHAQVGTTAAASKCRTVVVLAAGEGSGCTTLAVNVASELARLDNSPCILGEQSVAFGRLANFLHICPHTTLYDLVTEIGELGPERMRRALTRIEDNFSVLVGSYLTIRPFTVTPEIAFKVLACTTQLARTVVVDARHNFDEVDFEFAAMADHLVLVGKPAVSSLNDLRTLVESFERRKCQGQRYVVINQYDDAAGYLSQEAIARHLNVPDVFLVAADSAAFRTAETEGLPLRKVVGESKALDDICSLAYAILGRVPEPPPRWSLKDSLTRLAHSLGGG